MAETQRPHESGDGFTLVELLVVVVIIGILIAIAIPVYVGYTRSSHDRAAQSDLRAAISVLETCRADGDTYPGGSGVTYTSSAPVVPCAGQRITMSGGTTLTYTASSGASSYVLLGSNTGGRITYYCYNSMAAGSVRSSTAPLSTC